MKLSVIIPSYKDPLLQKTIDSILENSGLRDQLEIIVVLDGYWPAIDSGYNWSDKRIKILHLGRNRGMREAINAGVEMSTGEFIMRTDEHCSFGPNFDKIILERFKDDWIVTPRRYFLDPIKWEIMKELPPNDYNKLLIDETHGKFSGVDWKSRTKERANKEIDETMAMQGSCWFMKRSWWNKVIIRLETEGYGPLYQDSHEMVFKTWQAGGRLMVNKKTWHAHKHRDFSRTHNYGSKEAKPGWEYSLEKWGEYYRTVVKPKWNI